MENRHRLSLDVSSEIKETIERAAQRRDGTITGTIVFAVCLLDQLLRFKASGHTICAVDKNGRKKELIII